jgi:general secretion pathway protein D
MKPRITIYLAAFGASGLLLAAAAQPADQSTIARAEGQFVASVVIASRGIAPQTTASGTNQNDLNLNFVSAPLDQVLAYLSDAAGFIVVQQTRVTGYVTIKGSHITKDQTVDLLNSELNRNNYAAIRDGRMLTIMNKSDARTSRIPVKVGNDPKSIPNTDEIATWIVPIRFVEARQLVSDLSLFVSPQATVVANEAGNSIVITDTQANIRHLVQIIQLVDGSAESETEIRVFPLKHASPVDVANELSGIFSNSSGSDSQSPFTFSGPPGGPGGGPMPFLGNDGTTTSSSQQRIQKATQVTAVTDSRIQAVIVTAPKDLMTEIAGIMTELDVPSDRDQTVATIQLQNGDPQQVAQVLQNMFGGSSTSSTGTSSQSSALQTRAQSTSTSMGTTTISSSLGSSSSSSGGGRTGAAN